MSATMQSSYSPPVAALAWLGRQGTRALAALVFIGLAVPPLGEMLRPYISQSVFVLLCISFTRVDVAALRTYLSRPMLVVGATLWSAVGIPLLFAAGSLITRLDQTSPELFLGVMLQSVTSPMNSAPALVALMGLDATLVLITLVTTTALVPFTAPLIASLFFGGVLSMSPMVLGLKLVGLLAGAIVVATVIRRLAGPAAIVRYGQAIDGFTVIVLLVLVSGLMGSVAMSFWADPVGVLLVTLLAFGTAILLLGLTVLVFRKAGHERAWALGFMVSQRNLGLMLAAANGGLPGLTWLYFALSQFPIYLFPQFLKPLFRRERTIPEPRP